MVYLVGFSQRVLASRNGTKVKGSDSLHNSLGTIRVEYDAFWPLQCPSYLPTTDEPGTKEVPWKVRPSILGRYYNLLQDVRETQRTCQFGIRSIASCFFNDEAKEMQVHTKGIAIPRTHNFSRRNQDGS